MRRKQYKMEAAGEREKRSNSNEEQLNPDLWRIYLMKMFSIWLCGVQFMTAVWVWVPSPVNVVLWVVGCWERRSTRPFPTDSRCGLTADFLVCVEEVWRKLEAAASTAWVDRRAPLLYTGYKAASTSRAFRASRNF